MRHPLVMGNWKLNGSTHMVNELIAALRNELSTVEGCGVAIAPPEVYLSQAKHALAGSRIALGAQNVDTNLSGAFTGETSADMLKDAGLIPVLCIGETEAENEAGQTEAVCAKQLNAVLNTLGAKAFEGAVIAYEPVWAIGTGKSATPAQAQAVHKFIRDHVAKQDAEIAKQVIIQYGGSVNAANAAELFTQPDIDGALVGGASLKADAFAVIVKAAAEAKKA